MSTLTEHDTVTLTLTINEHLAEMLPSNSAPNFYAQQPDRFELLGEPGLPLPDAPVFAGGTMSWFDGVTELVLFRAYEEQCGYAIRPLYDNAGEQGFVLVSSRPNPRGIGTDLGGWDAD